MLRGLAGEHMILHQTALVLAASLLVTPFCLAGFASHWSLAWLGRRSLAQMMLLSAALAIPYCIVSLSYRIMSPAWLILYGLMPPGVVGLLAWARETDPMQRGTVCDFAVLGLLGLAVDLRWFEPAWPPHLAVFNKMLLLDLGILGFFGTRRLEGVGFDLRVRGRDLLTGLREFAIYAPVAIAAGLWMGFLHLHHGWPRAGAILSAATFTFLFIAVPEELFFRGWLQNLLEQRLGRRGALAVTAVLFGLSHFNKRTAHFNWRYVLLAALAGVFYGRAWRRDRRVAASAVTHTLVDTVWSLVLR